MIRILKLLGFLASCLLIPIFRIPCGKLQSFELEVLFRVIDAETNPLRYALESGLGNMPLFFKIEDDKPTSLFIKRNDLPDVPDEYLRWKKKSKDLQKTLILNVEVKQALIGKYLPAKIVSYRFIDKRPQVCK